MTFLLVAITEYYTGTRWKPVKDIAKASQTGHATNIISGLAVGMQATALPVIVIAVGIVGSYYAACESLYGIGVAVMAQLSHGRPLSSRSTRTAPSRTTRAASGP